MTETELLSLLTSLRLEKHETEWLEFKHNNEDPETIGRDISALANAAALLGKDHSFFVWGIQDKTHEVLGTTFQPRQAKVGNEELESWLSHHLSPRLDFRFHGFSAEDKAVVLLINPPAQHTPVRWKETAYIRVGSYTKKLNDYPEKERSLWLQLSEKRFESQIAVQSVSDDEVLSLLDYDLYYRLTQQPLPTAKTGILERLAKEKMVVPRQEHFDITNFGAILFARRFSDFETLGRKAVRVVDYTGSSRIKGGKEFVADSGYAAGFEALITYIKSRLPNNTYIAEALRVESEVYPGIAIRELIANAIIHQDFSMVGDSPMVQIFDDRLEITNPGKPLISTLRFIDEPPQSRNENLARFMRRVKICEEQGSGIDKVIAAVEFWQLPAPDFSVTERHTRVYLYAYRPFREMSSLDRTRACYQHVALMREFNQPATNASLRKRFGFEEEGTKTVSKIISDAIKEGLIKPYDPDNKSPRYARYIPWWA